MRLPILDTYLEYVAGVDGAGVNDFVAPDLTPSGMPYTVSLSTLLVHVNDTEVTTGYTENPDGTITFDTDLEVNDSLKLWRVTPVTSSLVIFPVPTKYSPRDSNKSLTQLLLCIQELWGGLKELRNELVSAQGDLQDYVNNAIAAVFQFSGTAVAIWNASMSAGDTILDTPYVFTKGLLIAGGTIYNLGSDVTLSLSGGFTRITLPSALLVDKDVILVVL